MRSQSQVSEDVADIVSNAVDSSAVLSLFGCSVVSARACSAAVAQSPDKALRNTLIEIQLSTVSCEGRCVATVNFNLIAFVPRNRESHYPAGQLHPDNKLHVRLRAHDSN